MTRRNLLMFGLPVAAVLLLLYGVVERERALRSLSNVAKAQSVTAVQIITPTPGPSRRPIVLPGTVRAWYQAPIFGTWTMELP
jgi:hypothetical protein